MNDLGFEFSMIVISEHLPQSILVFIGSSRVVSILYFTFLFSKFGLNAPVSFLKIMYIHNNLLITN